VGGLLGGRADVKVLSNNDIFISYHRSSDNYLRFASSSNGGASWASTTITNFSPANSWPATIAVPNVNNIFVVGCYSSAGNTLKFASSSNGGATWTTKTLFNGGEYPSMYAVDANTIFVGSQKSTSNSDSNMYFSKSTNGGINWSFSYVDFKDYSSYNSISAVDANNIFASYSDYASVNFRFAKSTDGGSNWTYKFIDYAGSSGNNSSIKAVDTNNIFISYYDGTNSDLKLAKSTDGGTSWATSTVDATGAVGQDSSIDALDSNNIFISYYDSTNGDLRFIKSTNGGSTWSSSTAVDSTGSVGLETSIKAANTNNIFISYRDNTNSDLKFAKSTDGGTSWILNTLDSNGSVGYYTSLDIVGVNNIFITYTYLTSYDIRFAKSTDGGTSWATGTVDTFNNLSKSYVSAVDVNTIFISYFDDTTDDLKFASSTNGGTSWTTTTLYSANSVGYYPAIDAVSANNIFILHNQWSIGELLLTKYSAIYYSTGTFTSSIKDTVVNAGFGTFTWSDSGTQTITMRARTGNQSNLSDASDWSLCSAITKGADISSNSCVHDTNRYIQYQAVLTTSDTSQTPTLQDVTINYDYFPTSTPSLTSSWYDSSSEAMVVGTIAWQEPTTLPTSTDARLTFQTAPDNGSSAPNTGSSTGFLGPDGATTTYWNSANTTAGGCSKSASGEAGISNVSCNIFPSVFTDSSNDRWFSFKVALYSDGRYSPIVYQTSLQYVVNSAPVVSSVKDENGVSDLNQNATGSITLTYNLADEDNTSGEVYFFYDIGTTLNDEGGSLAQSGETDIVVSNGTYFPSSGAVLIDSEVINYSSKSDSNTLAGLTRGEWPGTVSWTTRQVAHTNSTIVYLLATSTNQGAKTGLSTTTSNFFATIIPSDTFSNFYSASTSIRVAANDGNAANQISTSTGARSASFVLDVKNPSSPSISINSGASESSSTNVSLTLSVTDDSMTPGSQGYMMVSNNSDFSGAAWQTYNTSLSWSLTSGDGTKTVYVKFRDVYDNISSTTNDTILLDQTPPDTPTNVVIRDLTNSSTGEYRMFVAWGVVNNPARSDFKQYNIWRSTDGVDYGSSAYTVNNSRTLNYITETGLTASTTYYYKITSQDNLGNISATSSVVYDMANGQGGTDATEPVISNIATSSVTSQSATVTWETDELANSVVGYSTSQGVFTSNSAILTMATSHSVVLSGLSANTVYYFRVQSQDPSGNTATNNNGGNGYSFRTTAGPTISAVAVAEATNNTAKIVWTTNNPSTSYVIYSTSSDLSNSQTSGTDATSTSHQVTLSGLSQATQYFFFVRSTDESQVTTEDKNIVSGGVRYYQFSTLQDSQAPTISNIVVLSSTSTAAITWRTDELTNTYLDYGLTSSYGNSTTTATSTIQHSVYLSGLTDNTTYHFRIIATDLNNNPSTSSDTTFVTKDATGPVISNVATSSVSLTSIVVAWTTNESANSAVEYGTTSSLGLAKNDLDNYTISHQLTLTGLEASTTYYFLVRSIDSSGNAVTSSQAAFRTSLDSTAPVIASGPATSTVSDTRATIIWTTNELSTSQIFYGATNSYGSQTTLDATLTYQHAVSLTDLTKQTTYHYYVVSADAAGNSTSSADAVFTTTDNPGIVETITITRGGGGGSQHTTPPVISEIKVSEISSETAVVSWKTDEGANSFVEYGLSKDYNKFVGDYRSVLKHQLKLEHLTPSSLYHFKVISQDSYGIVNNQTPDQTFTTLAAGELPEIAQETTATSSEAAEQTKDSEEGLVEKVINILSSLKQPKSLLAVSTALQTSAQDVVLPLQIIGGIPEIQAGPDFAVVLWATDQPANSIVSFSKEDDYNIQSPDVYQSEMGNLDEQAIEHEVKLTGLTPSTRYHYRIKSKSVFGMEARSSDLFFETTSLTPRVSEANLISVGETEITINWKTDLPSMSELEITDIASGQKIIKQDSSYLLNHQFKVDGLTPLTNYNLKIVSQSENGLVASSQVLPFSTVVGSEPPSISQVRISAALVPGRVEKVQTIITWKTNKPSTSKFYFSEGFAKQDQAMLGQSQDKKLVVDHIIITTSLKPGKVYQFKVESQDAGNNITLSPKYVFLTPKPKQNVIDLIINNFEDSFGFMRNMRR
jgi:hypothetical protein